MENTVVSNVVVALVPGEAGKILTVRRRRGHADGIEVSLPSGIIESDETEKQAVVREVFEETGLIVTAHKKIGEIENHDVKLHYWACAVTGGDLRAEPNGATHGPTYMTGAELVASIAPRMISAPVAAYLGL